MNRKSFTTQSSSEENSGEENSGEENSGEENSGEENSGEESAGTERQPLTGAAPTPRRIGLLQIAGSWFGFSGLDAATGGTCPFCGQPTCPTGFLSAGIVGGILAIGLQAWRRFQK